MQYISIVNLLPSRSDYFNLFKEIKMKEMKVWVWVLPLCIILHIIEEFVFPGGFMLWYQKYKPAIASSIKPRFLIIVNALLLLVCINPINNVYTYSGIIWWLCIVSILAVNVFFHIKGTIESKMYSPGTITCILLYLPLTIYGTLFRLIKLVG